jgi:hypothetical protein
MNQRLGEATFLEDTRTRVEARRNLNLSVCIGSIKERRMVESVDGRLKLWVLTAPFVRLRAVLQLEMSYHMFHYL